MKQGVLPTRRVVWLLAKLALRRLFNRLSPQFLVRRKRKDGDEKRRGTPSKSRMRMPLVGLLSVVFVFNGVMIASQMLNKLTGWAEKNSRECVGVLVTERVFERLVDLEKRWGNDDGTVSSEAREDAIMWFKQDMTEDRRGHAKDEGYLDGGLTAEGELRCEHLADHFQKYGSAGFVADPASGSMGPFGVSWPTATAMPRFLDGLGFICALLWLSLLVMTFTAASQELGKIEWTLEWLYTFPAGARGLFLARVFEYALTQMFSWLTIFPLLMIVFAAWGAGFWSIPLALVATLYQNIVIGSVRVLGETWLRLNFGVARLKNLQALFSVIGILCFYCVLYLAIGRGVPDWFDSLASGSWTWLAWMPANLPLLFVAGTPLVGALFAHAVVLLVVLALGVSIPSKLVSKGLMRTGGNFQGTRRASPARQRVRESRGWMKGVLGKEVRLLFRDRSFFVQTLVLPILIIGFQVVLNSRMLTSGVDDFRHAGAIAFGVGAYVLMFGAASVLTVEGPALWLLYTFPTRLDSVLRRKTTLWGLISSIYCGAVLLWLGLAGNRFDLTVVESSFMALVGVVIYSFITAGIATMNARPEDLQTRRLQRRSNPEVMMLYLVVGPLYGYAIYAPSMWTRFAVVLLFGLLACAIWQKVRERIPFLLDPTALPPPRITLSDGLIAVLIFFVLQGVFMASAIAVRSAGRDDPGPVHGEDVTLSFVIAGALVVLGTFYVCWRKKIPDMLRTVGLRRKDDAAVGSFGGILLGALLGLVAAGAALLYLKVVEAVPALRELRDSTQLVPGETVSADFVQWLVPLAILAAPIFEEFIFRGLVYTGLRRTYPVWVSAGVSAAVFALVHPAIALPPVFLLGVFTALVFEWSGLLLSAIAAHAVYNFVVIFAQNL